MIHSLQEFQTKKSHYKSICLEGVKKFYVDFMVNTGIEYKINKRFVIYTQPYMRYALTPLNSAQNTVRTYPYSFGLGLGITYKF